MPCVSLITNQSSKKLEHWFTENPDIYLRLNQRDNAINVSISIEPF